MLVIESTGTEFHDAIVCALFFFGWEERTLKASKQEQVPTHLYEAFGKSLCH